MERIICPQVLLLENSKSDVKVIQQLLHEYEEKRMIRVMEQSKNALGFFSDASEPPGGIILFMNSKISFGIVAGELHRMATLPQYFTLHSETQHHLILTIIRFMMVVCSQKSTPVHFEN